MKKLTIFELGLMAAMFCDLIWMKRFLPASIAEWGILFVFWVYVFYEMWSGWRANR